MQALVNLAVPVKPLSIIRQSHENDSVVLNSEDGFLVLDQHSGKELEVQSDNGSHTCQCLLAQVAPESPCEHIRAVEVYLCIPDRKLQLSQADADIFLSRVAKVKKIIQRATN